MDECVTQCDSLISLELMTMMRDSSRAFTFTYFFLALVLTTSVAATLDFFKLRETSPAREAGIFRLTTLQSLTKLLFYFEDDVAFCLASLLSIFPRRECDVLSIFKCLSKSTLVVQLYFTFKFRTWALIGFKTF